MQDDNQTSLEEERAQTRATAIENEYFRLKNLVASQKTKLSTTKLISLFSLVLIAALLVIGFYSNYFCFPEKYRQNIKGLHYELCLIKNSSEAALTDYASKYADIKLQQVSYGGVDYLCIARFKSFKKCQQAMQSLYDDGLQQTRMIPKYNTTKISFSQAKKIIEKRLKK